MVGRIVEHYFNLGLAWVTTHWVQTVLVLGVLALLVLTRLELRQKKAQRLPRSDNYSRCPNCGNRAHAGLKCGAL